MPAKLTSGSVSTTSNTPRQASRRGEPYSGMKRVECTRQRCKQGEGRAGCRQVRDIAQCSGAWPASLPAKQLNVQPGCHHIASSSACGCSACLPACHHRRCPPTCVLLPDVASCRCLPACVTHLRLCRSQVHLLVVPLHVVRHLWLAASEHSTHCRTGSRSKVERAAAER
jgi:hypothetical protein